MAKREISIRLSAKNAMAAGIAKASAQLKRFGKAAGRIGKKIAVGFIVAGAAVAAFAVKALKALSAQETAERALTDALRAHGDEIKNTMEKSKAYASAIQDETGVGDENVLARMARLRMLGVEASKLGEAAKATIALKSAGMEEAAAIKAVAMAQQGSFEMLNRYIPALRNATEESEKAQLVNDFLTKGYEQQKGQLDTLPGAWEALKGRVGDAMEVIGTAINQNGVLTEALKRAGDAVKALGEKITKWLAGGGMIKAFSALKLAVATAGHTFRMMGNVAEIAVASISDGFATMSTYIGGTVTALGDFIKTNFQATVDVILAAWKFIKRPTAAAFKHMAVTAAEATETAALSYVKLAKDIAREAGSFSGEVITKRTEAALEKRLQLEEDHAKTVADLEAEKVAALAAVGKKRVDDAETVLDQIAIAEENHNKKMDESVKKSAALEKELANRAKSDREKEEKERLAGLEKQMAAQKELAAKTIEAFMAEARAAKDLAAQQEKEADRADRLKAKEGRGTKLSKGDREWLDAFNAIQGAKGKAAKGGDLADNIAIAKDNLAQLQKDGKTQVEIRNLMMAEAKKQDKLRKDLSALLMMG